MKTRSSAWLETNEACEELGLKAKQLRKLRTQMKAGYHFRVKNPKSARPSYLWQVERVKALLIPEGLNHG